MGHIQGLVITAYGEFCLYVAYRGKEFWKPQSDGSIFKKICGSAAMRPVYFVLGLLGIFEGVRLVLGFEFA